MLPYIVKEKQVGNWDRIHKVVNRVLGGTVVLMFFGILATYLLMDLLVEWYVGVEFLLSSEQVKLLMWGGLLYVVYVVLRNPLDAISHRPYNSANLSVTLFLVCFLIYLGTEPVTSLILGMLLIGSLSYCSWIVATRKEKKSNSASDYFKE